MILKITSRSLFGASPSFRITNGLSIGPRTRHAQPKPCAIDAICPAREIFSWTRPEINYYILGSTPLSIFSTIFKREPQVVIMKAPLAYKAITLGVLGSIISISQVSTIKYRFSDDFEIRHLIFAKFAAWLKLMDN